MEEHCSLLHPTTEHNSQRSLLLPYAPSLPEWLSPPGRDVSKVTDGNEGWHTSATGIVQEPAPPNQEGVAAPSAQCKSSEDVLVPVGDWMGP
ncbi:unnamed protein product [Nezara viridula]|uniref:Uncharacterized protein n=1 Tax=Nezara viridula TaxID=85310 RepID=A0A9P0MTN4_NEZVI|nr:unnamed protein product [Nezara viridula]